VKLTQRIVRDTHGYKKRKEIQKFVEAEWHSGQKFALQESDVFWDIHRRGVKLFGRKYRLQSEEDIEA
jgi:hypothetical protein